MALKKFSQIAAAGASPALTDTLIGVGSGATDLQYTLTQLQPVAFAFSGLAATTISAAASGTVPLTISGYSLTGSQAQSLLSLTGTINTSGSPDIIKIVVTKTAAGASTNIINLIGGAAGNISLFSIDMAGAMTVLGQVTAGGSVLTAATTQLAWVGRGIMTSPAAGTVQLGATAADTNALIVAQTIRAQPLAAGGTSNQAGKDLAIQGSAGKGTGAGGAILLQTTLAGTTGTAINAFVTGLTIQAGCAVRPSYTVANLPAAATAGAGAMAWVTDATATTFLSVVAGGGANKVPVSSDGTNWLIG